VHKYKPLPPPPSRQGSLVGTRATVDLMGCGAMLSTNTGTTSVPVYPGLATVGHALGAWLVAGPTPAPLPKGARSKQPLTRVCQWFASSAKLDPFSPIPYLPQKYRQSSWKGNEWPGPGGSCGDWVRVHRNTMSKQ
jgi:hypothetical protein